MRHFVVYPSALPVRGEACAKRWIEKGYEVLVQYDAPSGYPEALAISVNRETPNILWKPKPFPGYYKSINAIVVQAFDLGADLVTCIGDDMDPPAQGAQYIAEQYFNKFPDGFGVMQPCGDPQGDLMLVPGYEHLGPLHNAGRICGSPVFGRAWSVSGYATGGFCERHTSFYGDECLWNRAMKLGVLWLDKETTHLHNHWSWGKSVKQPYHEVAQRNWLADKESFEKCRSEGFPA